MKKEKSESIPPLSNNLNAIRKLESSHFIFRDRQNALESSASNTYEWFEDCLIRGMASVEFGKDTTGKDTAKIKTIDPETKDKQDIYYTTDEIEVARLKIISEGKTLIIDDTETE